MPLRAPVLLLFALFALSACGGYGRPNQSASQLAFGMDDERRAVADRAQPADGQQRLILAAAPGPARVDVEGEH